jgi:protein TonB
MSPAAMVLAVLLHVLAGMAIWWLQPLQPTEPKEEPIMVMFDSSPSNVGLQTPERAGPPAESAAASPQPSTEPPREEQQQQALASPPSQAQPQPEPVPTLPIYEFSVPPVPEPPPAPTSRDFPKPPAAAPTRPVQRTLPPQPRPAPPAQQRPPAEAPATMPSPIPGPDPGDVLVGQGRQRNDYLSRVFRHLAPYRARNKETRAAGLSGRVGTRVVLARDGSVLSVTIEFSSGRPVLDGAELDAVRNASPFPPVPDNMPGNPVAVHLTMNY